MSEIGLGSEGGRGAARTRSRGCVPVLVAALLIGALGVFAYVRGVDLLKDVLSSTVEDYPGDGRGSVVVEVESGDTSTDIAAALLAAGVVKSQEAFVEAAKANPESTSIQVGFYQLKKEMSGESALELLLSSDSRVSDALTIPEGRRAEEILELIVGNTEFSKSEVRKAFADTRALGLPSYAEGVAEGYLFPATYEVTPNMSAADLLAKMVDTFEDRADAIDLEGEARRLGVSPHDVVIVASLVQGEASRVQDMPKVASVTYNRLDIDMLLQFDSTLKYAVGSRGDIVTGGDLLDLDSPYNSYKYPGLPPTAIGSPGEDALEAALSPAGAGFLYFVTVDLKTGETRFSEDYDDFLVDKAEYERYCTTSDAC